MEINWFTFGAQILNFFVLIFVLQRFLYKPITKAMARREKTISDRLSSASEQKEEAEQEVKHYQEMQQQFTDQKTELLTQAKSEVEETRQRLLKEMRESVAKERSQWQSNLQRQKDAFLHEVGDRTMQQLQATVRRVLTDLAESELETQIARVFLQKLRDLTETERAELVTTLTDSTKDSIPLTLVSTFTLPPDICAAIATVLQDYFQVVGSGKIESSYEIAGRIEPTYEIESSLICGIELRGTGYKLAWSMDTYLDSITENLVTVFAEKA